MQNSKNIINKNSHDPSSMPSCSRHSVKSHESQGFKGPMGSSTTFRRARTIPNLEWLRLACKAQMLSRQGLALLSSCFPSQGNRSEGVAVPDCGRGFAQAARNIPMVDAEAWRTTKEPFYC